MKRERETDGGPGGLAGWLLARWHKAKVSERRLVLEERITLGPRQTLCLVKADGRSILVANSADGVSFYPLERPGLRGRHGAGGGAVRGRISW